MCSSCSLLKVMPGLQGSAARPTAGAHTLAMAMACSRLTAPTAVPASPAPAPAQAAPHLPCMCCLCQPFCTMKLAIMPSAMALELPDGSISPKRMSSSTSRL